MSLFNFPGHEPADNIAASNSYGIINIWDNAQVLLGNAVTVQDGRKDTLERADKDLKLLLGSLYFDSMNLRKQQIVAGKERTCDWIWTTSFESWLGDDESRIFWISGKPGSGKSTLMKYLSDCHTLRSKLPIPRRQWIVVSFFFDSRLAQQIGNTAEGFLRSLLFQIIAQSKDAAQYVQHGTNADLGDLSLQQLKKSLSQVLKRSEYKLLILVDGLDEYQGNTRVLITYITSLLFHKNIKLCLASRASSMIREVLAFAPSLLVSDHNLHGIQHFVQESFQHFRPLLKSLHIQDIESRINERAEGLFLWARFAVEEVLQASVAGATPAEIRNKLDLLPTELEELYQSILDRIPAERQQEAAVLYALVSSATTTSLMVLKSALHFVLSEFDLPDPAIGVRDTPTHFARRIQSILGGILKLTTTPSSLDTSTELFEETSAGVTSRQFEAVPDLADVTTIHRTVIAFTDRSGWVSKWLPPKFNTVFPDRVWSRLCARSLAVGSAKLSHRIEELLDEAYGKAVSYNDFKKMLQHHSDDDNLKHWTALLHFSIKKISHYHAKARCLPKSDEHHADLVSALRCRLATLHFALHVRHYISGMRPLREVLEPSMSDLILAAAHREYSYILDNQSRVANLTDNQRDDLVIVILFYSRRDDYGCSIDGQCTSNVHDLVNMVFICNEKFYSWHLAVYLVLGYSDIPSFLQKLRRSASGKPLQSWSSPYLPPKWTLLAPPTTRQWFPELEPLFLWASDTHNLNNFPQQRRDIAVQLELLLSLGIDINYHNQEDGRNVVHHIVVCHAPGKRKIDTIYVDSARIRHHNGAPVETYEKLYLVEEAGADFEASSLFGTPLREHEFEIEWWSRRGFSFSYPVLPVLIETRYFLQHKKSSGHLPIPVTEDLSKSVDGSLHHCDICNDDFPRPALISKYFGQATTIPVRGKRGQSLPSDDDAKRQRRKSEAAVESSMPKEEDILELPAKKKEEETLNTVNTILPFLDSHQNLGIGSPASSAGVPSQEKSRDKDSDPTSDNDETT